MANGKTWAHLDHNEDLTSPRGRDQDIVKICDYEYPMPIALDGPISVVWQREEVGEVIEMTLQEACKKLHELTGKPIKITI